MNIEGIQQDYGGFDPRFLGVTIKFTNIRSWEYFTKSGTLDATHILDLSTLPERFEAIAVVTVLEHEVRHFHDFLLTPYSHLIFRLRLQALINGLQFLVYLEHQLEKNGYNCLPVPISRWCRKNQSERRALIESWNQLNLGSQGKSWHPIKLPILPETLDNWNFEFGEAQFSDKAQTDLLVATIRAYEKIKYVIHNPDTHTPAGSLQPCHIFELSALVVQIQQIWTAYGEDATSAFIEGLQTQIHLPHLRLFFTLMEMWSSRGELVDSRILSAIVLWSLLGNYEIDGWRASPEIRLLRLWDLLSKEGPPPSSSSIDRLFARWSKKTKLGNVNNGLERTLASNNRYVQRLSEMFSKSSHSPIYQFQNQILAAADMLQRSNEFMIHSFLDDPETYTHPLTYLSNYDKYVNPPIKLEFTGVSLVGTKEYFDQLNYEIFFAQENENGQLEVRSASPQSKLSNIETIHPKTAFETSMHMLIMDYLFSTFNRDDWELNAVKDMYFADTRVQPFNIF